MSIEVKSPQPDLLKSKEFSTFPTGMLQTMRIEWEEQRDLPGRSERSKEEVDKLLNRIDFELGVPNREDEFIVLSHAIFTSWEQNHQASA